MLDNVRFVETESEEQCGYCLRKKLKESEKFYKVFVKDKEWGMTVCELCKGGFLAGKLEGQKKTYVTHLAFYVKSALFELREKLPENMNDELISAIEDYENGRYSSSFRSIGFVAEWMTKKLFGRKFGEQNVEEEPKWENMLGRLLERSRNEKTKEEAMVHQLYFLKWFRNKAGHPSKHMITGEDVRIGLVSIAYLLRQLA